MKRFLLLTIIVATLVLGASGRTLAQEDSRIGKWTLNVAKSKYVPGPPPASETRSYVPQGHGLNVNIDSVDSTGKHVSLHYITKDDGSDSPMTGLAFADAIAMRRIDANTYDVDTKKSGKVVGTTRVVISKDGKVMILTSKMITPTGQAINNMGVFEKQQ